jgi:hypothetical protein
MFKILLSLLLFLWNATQSYSQSYSVEEHWFEARIDHFNYQPTTVPTFPLRYYVNQDCWNPQNGSVLFYAGNEADILQFVNNTGFMFEIAQELDSLVIFAEHRYYGLSNPFGNEYALGKGYNISFLTVEQAMQDFNTLTFHIRDKWNMTKSTPFIAFGGSYGANLSMWLRLKQPNLWAGAIASSVTPLKHLLRETNGFAKIETEVYANVSNACPDLIRQGWKELYESSETESGRIHIGKELSLCHPLEENGVEDVHGWISDALETMVQYGYPYPTSFYNPVPAFPFKVACEQMLDAGTGLGALKAAASIYYNYTGQAGTCFDFDSLILSQSRRYWSRRGRHELSISTISANMPTHEVNMDITKQQTKESRRLLSHDMKWTETDRAWGYQTCTEVYQPMPTNGITDFEVPYQPNQTAYFEYCLQEWGVSPRPNWEEMYFMGQDISAGSNIFITNGELDPWRAAGIQTLPKGSPSSIIVRTIEHGAHHLDLRASHPLDPLSVVVVRNEEKEHIKSWIQEWREMHS